MKVPDFSSLKLPNQHEAEPFWHRLSNYSFLPVYYLCSTRQGKSVELCVSRGYSFGSHGVQWGPKRGFTLAVVRECLEFIQKHHFGDPAAEEVLLNLLDGERRAFAEECLNRIAGERLLGSTPPKFSASGQSGNSGFRLLCEDNGSKEDIGIPYWNPDFAKVLQFISARRHPHGPSARSILRKVTPRYMQWELRLSLEGLQKGRKREHATTV